MEIYIYAYEIFKDAKNRYPSSHKEILAMKKNIARFWFFLKPVKFFVHTTLKYIAGMLQNERLLECGKIEYFDGVFGLMVMTLTYILNLAKKIVLLICSSNKLLQT